jgi:DNA-binding PadR family transcriptional regulator
MSQPAMRPVASDEELRTYLLALLAAHQTPYYASDLADRVKHRLPDRRQFYALMRALEEEGRVIVTYTRTGGRLYSLAPSAQESSPEQEAPW